MKSNIIPFQAPASSVTVRRLHADTITLTRDSHEMLTCTISGDALPYRGVCAVLLFPISRPDEWVSLRFTDATDKDREIGIIEDLRAFPEDTQQLIRESLARHYHEQKIESIVSIQQRYGQLFFKVRTQRGEEEFVTPWRQDRAEDWGTSGRVLLDALNNRYLIPDMNALKPRELRLLRTYIYW